MTDPTQPTTPPPVDVEKRVGQFVMLRDMKAALKEKHDSEMKPINDTMEMIKDELKVALNSVNADNMKTGSGTVSLNTKYSASAAVVAGQDFARFSDKLDRCISLGGDGLTGGARGCYKRQPIITPEFQETPTNKG